MPVKIDPSSIAFYALLHDVGKPIERLIRRAMSCDGEQVRTSFKEVERIVRLVESAYGKCLDCRELTRIGHDKLSRILIEKLVNLSPPKDVRNRIEELIKRADIMSAAERGFEEKYPLLKDHLSDLEKRINDEIGLTQRCGLVYSHHTAPLLSPLWIIKRSGYQSGTGSGLACGGAWDAERGLENVRKLFEEIMSYLGKGDIDNAFNKISELIKELSEEKLWIPVREVTPNLLIGDLRAMTLCEAMQKSSYSGIVRLILNHLTNASKWYTINSATRIPRGLTDTVLNVMKAATLLVPSAVYGAIVPDISLYSHSKLVAAYSSAMAASGDDEKIALLSIDANNIQAFIYSSTKAAAASRLMRGRSFIVEIALESLARYALELMGGLTEANVIISEGGSLVLVVPCVPDLKERLDLLRDVAAELSKELGGVLEFTIAVSECFSDNIRSFLSSAASSGGYAHVAQTLRQRLATEKLSKIPAKAPSTKDVINYIPEAYDALTKEPILKNNKKLFVDKNNLSYVTQIAADKLAEGDVISFATHLSLVAGTSLRNAIAVISLYAYKDGWKHVGPDKESIGKLVDILREKLSEKGKSAPEALYYIPVIATNVKLSVSLIPLESAGALHMIISSVTPAPRNVFSEEEAPLWGILGTVLGHVADATREVLSEDEGARHILVRVSLINNTESFVPDPKINKELEKVSEKVGDTIDIGFGFRWLNTYHPVEVNESEGGISHLSLDRYSVIALSKIDLDMFGDVMTVLTSVSPSRASTASDLANTVVSGAVYAIASKYAIELDRFGRNFDAIPLYGGGDDITIYGSVGAVSFMTAEVLKKIADALQPVTASASIIIDDSHTPILDIYSDAIERLEDAKVVRSAVAMATDEPRSVRVSCGDGRVIEKIINVIPVTVFNAWRDAAVDWPFEVLRELLCPLTISNNLAKLEAHKNILQKLSFIGYMAQDYLKSAGKNPVKKARVSVAYAYLWARYGGQGSASSLVALKKSLEDISSRMVLPIPSNVDATVNTLSSSKPIIDILLLALRRPETAYPSSKIKKK